MSCTSPFGTVRGRQQQHQSHGRHAARRRRRLDQTHMPAGALTRPPPLAAPADITNHWLPMWLAPNLITLIGVSALVASYATSAAYLPEFAGTAPLWLYFFR